MLDLNQLALKAGVKPDIVDKMIQHEPVPKQLAWQVIQEVNKEVHETYMLDSLDIAVEEGVNNGSA